MWSRNDSLRMCEYRLDVLKKAVQYPEMDSRTAETIHQYFQHPTPEFFNAPRDCNVLLTAYYIVLGFPSILLHGLSPLQPAQRFSEAYATLAKTERVKHKARSALILLQHDHQHGNSRHFVKTLNLLLPPPRRPLIHTSDFYPLLWAHHQAYPCYVPKYEYCFPTEEMLTSQVLESLGVNFYPLPPIPNPNKLAIASLLYLNPIQVDNALLLERSIVTSLIDPCCQAFDDPQDTRVFRFCYYMNSCMGAYYQKNRSLALADDLSDTSDMRSIKSKLRYYSRAVGRTLVVFDISEGGPPVPIMQEPPPGQECTYSSPYLFIGLREIVPNQDNPAKHLAVFSPSCTCAQDRKDLPNFPKTTKAPEGQHTLEQESEDGMDTFDEMENRNVDRTFRNWGKSSINPPIFAPWSRRRVSAREFLVDSAWCNWFLAERVFLLI